MAVAAVVDIMEGVVPLGQVNFTFIIDHILLLVDHSFTSSPCIYGICMMM